MDGIGPLIQGIQLLDDLSSSQIEKIADFHFLPSHPSLCVKKGRDEKMIDDHPGKVIRTYKMRDLSQYKNSTNPSMKSPSDDHDGTFYFVDDSEFAILDRIHTYVLIHI